MTERNLPRAKRPRIEIPKLLDGKYFTITKQDGFRVEATCSRCQTIRKGDINSTGNFMTHIRRKHPDLIEAVNLYKKSKEDIIVTSVKTQKTLNEMMKPYTTEEVQCFN